MNALEIEIVHKIDGPTTALLESLAKALLTRGASPSATEGIAAGRVKVVEKVVVTDEDLGAAADLRTEAPENLDTPPLRERGKPSAGKRKRTKAQMAEDDAADVADVVAAADAAASATPDPEKFMKELRELCRDYNKANGREATSKLFEGLSGGGVSTILPSEFSRLRDRLIAAGAGASPASDEANASLFDL